MTGTWSMHPVARLRCGEMPISGGLVRWYRDVGPLRRRQALLERLNQDLNWSYELLSCLSDIRRQAIDQGVTLRVYRELEEIIAG